MNHKQVFSMAPSTSSREPLFTLEEVADKLGVGITTLRGMVFYKKVTKVFDSKPSKYRLSDFKTAMMNNPAPEATDDMYQIERDVPVPSKRGLADIRETKIRGLLSVMQTGDSILVKTNEVAYIRGIAKKMKFETTSRTTATTGVSRLWRLT